MWIIYALLSAFFAGIVSILAKIGGEKIDSTVMTALRTMVVLLFAWLMVFVVGSANEMGGIDKKSLLFLILSGLATGGSWLCYFKALQIGDVNKVVAVDKSSTVLTMILSMIFLGEAFTIKKGIAMILIGCGTYMMIEKKKSSQGEVGYNWLFYALLAAFFASLTAILSKVGITGVDSTLGTAIRTIVVAIMAWLIVFMQKKQGEIKYIDKRSWGFIGLSGIATGLSWLFYYKGLQEGLASVVVPIDKLSILVTVLFGYVVFGEKLNKKSQIGLFFIVLGTLCLLI